MPIPEAEREGFVLPEKEGKAPFVEKPKEAEEKETAVPTAVPTAARQPAPEPGPSKSFMLKEIENILSEDLEDIYFNLPADLRQEFRAKGEETASKIEQLLQKTRVKVRGILKLIMEWLKTIPGVNHFFLEQESKIKADKILGLKKDK